MESAVRGRRRHDCARTKNGWRPAAFAFVSTGLKFCAGDADNKGNMNLRSFSVRARLIAGFAVLTVAFLAVTGLNTWRAWSQSEVVMQLLGERARQQAVLQAWQSEVAQDLVRTQILLRSGEADVAAALNADMKAAAGRIGALQKQAQDYLSDAEGKASFDAVVAARKAYADARKEAVDARNDEDYITARKLLSRKVDPTVKRYLDAVQAALTMTARNNEALAAQARKDVLAAARDAILSAIAGVVASVALAWLISRSITGPLNRAVSTITQVAGGDLRVQLQDASRDELGNLARQIDAMANAMASLLHDMQESSASVMVASRQIASGNKDLSARTETQAASLQQSAAAVEALTATVQNNAAVSRQASAVAGEAAAVTVEAGRCVETIEASMGHIRDSSTRVNDIVGLIDNIAFQTNILALNAAVEAARAGEHGLGFAVVAAEVRNLAQRSAQSAKEIKGIVAASMEQIAAGVGHVRVAGTTMQSAREKVVAVQAMVDDIANATQKQASGLQEINQVISGLDGTTQQNSSMVQQSAAATENLSEQAQQLTALANQFKLAA